MFPPCFHAGRGKDDPAFEYPLHAGGVQFGVVVGVLNDPAAVFLVFRTAKMRLSIDVIFSYKKPILFIVPFSKSLCCALRCFNACALLNRTLYRLFLTEWYGDTQSIKRLTMQRIRPPRFEFAFDAELFPFQYHKPAFVVLFQFPPTYKTPTIRIAYPSIDYSILTVTLYAHYDGGSFPRNPPQRGL